MPGIVTHRSRGNSSVVMLCPWKSTRTARITSVKPERCSLGRTSVPSARMVMFGILVLQVRKGEIGVSVARVNVGASLMVGCVAGAGDAVHVAGSFHSVG